MHCAWRHLLILGCAGGNSDFGEDIQMQMQSRQMIVNIHRRLSTANRLDSWVTPLIDLRISRLAADEKNGAERACCATDVVCNTCCRFCMEPASIGCTASQEMHVAFFSHPFCTREMAIP